TSSAASDVYKRQSNRMVKLLQYCWTHYTEFQKETKPSHSFLMFLFTFKNKSIAIKKTTLKN
ncbi:hypothetical protein KQJ29_21795, partial [Enterococcus sp. S181_ASV_20]|nr:hypothetical protein [Enterococcus sp. S181_ASV_20]